MEYQSVMTLPISTGHWELRQILIPISQCRWWDPHVDLLLGIPSMKIFRHVDKLLFYINTIGIHQNISSRYIQDKFNREGAKEQHVQPKVDQSS